MTVKKTLTASAVMVSIFIAPVAFAFKEYPAGEPVTMNEMELAAAYLQPIDTELRGMGLPAARVSVHLEADIHAVEGNKNGFDAGEWIPYLTTSYTLVDNDTGERQEGTSMSVVVNDGPCYGANIKIMDVSNCRVTYHIEPPSKAGMHRHTDSETGVGRWRKPFDVSYKLRYVGLN